MPVGWRLGCRASCPGRFKVGLSRVQSGQFSLFWSFASEFEHDSSLSLLGIGQLTGLQGPCIAFRFLVSGSHGFRQYALSNAYSHSGTGLLYHCYISVFDAIALGW